MSPRTKKQFEQIRESRKAAIQEAALELFAHKSYGNTSISDIAKKAGVSKRLLYNYFKSKQDLLQAIIQTAMEEGEKLLQSFMQQDSSPAAQLKGIIEGSIAMITSNLEYWKLLTALAFQQEAMGDMGESPRIKSKETIRMITALFQELGEPDPEEASYLFGAVMDGIMIHYMYDPENYPMDRMRRYLINRFCAEQAP